MSTGNTHEQTMDIIGKSSRLMEDIYKKGPFAGIRYTDKAIFVGDTHGSFEVSEKILDSYLDKFDMFVFLGDYVDYAMHGLENLTVILEKFLSYPDRIVLLRGNHESPLLNEYYGFKKEVLAKIGPGAYQGFVNLFQKMPYSVVVNDWLCVHGGLARNLSSVEEIESLPKNDADIENQIAFELLWNDPREDISGFVPSARGPDAYYFGQDVFEEFINNNDLTGMIRGHEVVNGYRDSFSGKLITVFSSIHHGVRPGIVLLQDGNMKKSFVDL